MTASLLWVPVTLFASLAQVWRNALQSDLTGKIGTLGATQVRFVYGLPFAWVFLGIAVALTGIVPVVAGWIQLGWIAAGALAQIAATALMLVAMRRQSFAMAYVYIKTEPVLIALGGIWLLGDRLSPLAWAGVVIATLGVMLAARPSAPKGGAGAGTGSLVIGIAAGALFGLSAIFFRGGILASGMTLDGFAGPVVAALFALALALTVQTAMLLGWMLLFDRKALTGSLAVWRVSMGAGFLGALASTGWFLAFALTPAANVRTLALVEMPAAALVNFRQSGKRLHRAEWLAMALVLSGVAMVLREAVR
ncbi:MAG: DMT family transporter [Blastomonas sp.]